MGLRYSFEIVTAKSRVDLLLRRLAEIVAAEDRERLLAAIPWSPEIDRVTRCRDGESVRLRYGITGLARHEERQNDYCLSFLFPSSDALSDYELLQRRTASPSRGRVPVGCVWSSLEAGRELAVLRCMAATTCMSVLFERCTGGRALWAELGWASNATAVFLDTEAEAWELVFPSGRTVPRPDEEPYLLEGMDLEYERYVHVDAYYGEALRLAGLARRT